MKTNISLLICCSIITMNILNAQESIFPKGKLAPNVYHTGDVWLNHLADADETFDYNVVLATFAPGAKLNWHNHPKGQQLYVTKGRGYYQERGKEVQLVKTGDVIKCTLNVEHWHAATSDSEFAYWAITGNAKTQWGEKLTQVYYDSVNAAVNKKDDIKAALLKLSKDKWQWMADKDVEKLSHLFHKDAQYVHMGGSWGTERELEIIESGGIWYKKATVHEASLDFMEDTAVVLNQITLLAEVGGNEVSNPFIVTEVYKKINGSWQLLNLSFVKQLVRE